LLLKKRHGVKIVPPLSIVVVLGRICVLKGGKETSDLAEYFPPFKTQVGPKIKKMASDYTSASLLIANQVRSSVTKTGVLSRTKVPEQPLSAAKPVGCNTVS